MSAFPNLSAAEKKESRFPATHQSLILLMEKLVYGVPDSQFHTSFLRKASEKKKHITVQHVVVAGFAFYLPLKSKTCM